MEEPTAAVLTEHDRCPRCGHEVAEDWVVCASCGEQVAAPAELPPGTELSGGRYRVLGTIARGGFGITYEGGDTRLRRRVAIKELYPDIAVRHGTQVLTPVGSRAAFRAARERFIREARVLARFTHPGVVRVYEVFEENGTAYLVMERLRGRTLVEVLRERRAPFTEDEVLDVAGRVAAALRPVHAAGVLHRDLNPSNAMITDHGRIVLIDFGLARDFDVDQTVGMTRMVTPGYAPLEQYRGEARFGPSTDVYGLAATCYRLATGKVPVAAIERDAGAPLPPPSKLNPAISKATSDALLDGLELEPGHRPQDLDSFLARLRIRRLPEGPRSVLLGSRGAEPEALAVALEIDAPFDLDPAVSPPVPSPSSVPAHASPSSPSSNAATELVAPSPAPPVPAGDRTNPAGDRTNPDVDRTRPEPDASAGPGVADPDATGPGAVGAGAVYPDVVGPDATAPDGSGAAPRWEPAAAVPAAQAPPGSRHLTVPLVAVALGAASAAPVVAVLVVVLLALPALATLGDWAAHHRRAASGIAGSWAERRLSPAQLVPVRFWRNVVASVLRAAPVLGVSALVLGAWALVADGSSPDGPAEVALRIIGVVTMAVLLRRVGRGSERFRVGDGVDQLVPRLVPDGRITERVLVMWVLAACLVALALWLSPDAFPLG